MVHKRRDEIDLVIEGVLVLPDLPELVHLHVRQVLEAHRVGRHEDVVGVGKVALRHDGAGHGAAVLVVVQDLRRLADCEESRLLPAVARLVDLDDVGLFLHCDNELLIAQQPIAIHVVLAEELLWVALAQALGRHVTLVLVTSRRCRDMDVVRVWLLALALNHALDPVLIAVARRNLDLCLLVNLVLHGGRLHIPALGHFLVPAQLAGRHLAQVLVALLGGRNVHLVRVDPWSVAFNGSLDPLPLVLAFVDLKLNLVTNRVLLYVGIREA
mmetsp:Transcript_51265/g.148852  ORF Transcript_51265/g.148852 Transcript_51265/m.148852 type:complete len:270 (+) Transcript_51265:1269-2078(+)